MQSNFHRKNVLKVGNLDDYYHFITISGSALAVWRLKSALRETTAHRTKTITTGEKEADEQQFTEEKSPEFRFA